MLIAKVNAASLEVYWVLVDAPTAEAVFKLETDSHKKRASRWGVIVCRVTTVSADEVGDIYTSAAWTSKKDEFNVGRGMGLSLSRALGFCPRPERALVWSAVLADPAASILIRNERAQREWVASASLQLGHRSASLHTFPDRRIRSAFTETEWAKSLEAARTPSRF